ncbi:MAG: LTA synthase family protein, partial [Erysipelotrichaceae bacterium]|nr:LTA synthase family protein [Erysipelotrichaceae bacterium]
YKTFGSLVSASMIGTGKDAVTSFGWSIKATINENIKQIILFEMPLLAQFIRYLFVKNHEPFVLKERFSMVVTGFVIWNLIVLALPLTGKADNSAYGAYHSRYVDTDTASNKLGAMANFVVETRYALFGEEEGMSLIHNGDNVVIEAEYEQNDEEEVEEIAPPVIRFNRFDELNFSKLEKLSDDETITSLCSYLNDVSPTRHNEYTGMFEGYNLIYICAESFSSLAIDKELTPTLYKLANNGIVLNNYYNSFKNVTTNGEYAFLTGVWPDVARQSTNMGSISGTMGQSIDKNMSTALGNMFNKNEGIKSRAYHNYYGYYYGRNQTLPNMGFDCKFMDDGMSFTTAWPASDYEMMEQSVDDYINDEQFCTYYMTFSGHGNYSEANVMAARNHDYVAQFVDLSQPISATGYLACNYELEKAMTYLVNRLEEKGILDKTVIVLTGDHYPYYLTDIAYEALKGEPKDEDFESYHSTCIIYNSGLDEKIEVDTPCCNVDILPTVYNLFGIDYDSRLYAGTDIFGNGIHIAQLYNKNFITDSVKYNFTTGEAQWLIDTEAYDEQLLNSYLENAINTVKNRYAMSIEIERSDFYRFVSDNME